MSNVDLVVMQVMQDVDAWRAHDADTLAQAQQIEDIAVRLTGVCEPEEIRQIASQALVDLPVPGRWQLMDRMAEHPAGVAWAALDCEAAAADDESQQAQRLAALSCGLGTEVDQLASSVAAHRRGWSFANEFELAKAALNDPQNVCEVVAQAWTSVHDAVSAMKPGDLLDHIGESLKQVLRPFETDKCSLFLDGVPGTDLDWSRCCVEHDLAYWKGGTVEERLAADEHLRACVVEKTDSPVLAALMYVAVRVGGMPDFDTSFRWGFGWPSVHTYLALSPRDIEMATALEQSYFDQGTRFDEGDAAVPYGAPPRPSR